MTTRTSENRTPRAGLGTNLRSQSTSATPTRPAAGQVTGRRTWAVLRISLSWVFLWAFLDKTFGLGAATESANAWIDGGSPTEGYLTAATRGPLKDWFSWMAGDVWADWLFMIGLLGIGLALLLGIGMRVAAATGSLLLVFMWAATLWPENNPFMDDHLIYAIALVGLAAVNAGDTWGLGQWWNRQALVRQHATLR